MFVAAGGAALPPTGRDIAFDPDVAPILSLS